MPQNESTAQMDIAATQAEAELRERVKNDPELGKAIVAVASWALAWYMKAGYKRLMKALISLAR